MKVEHEIFVIQFGDDCAVADDCDGRTIFLGSIGASIEGKLIGDKDKGIIQDYNSVRLTPM